MQDTARPYQVKRSDAGADSATSMAELATDMDTDTTQKYSDMVTVFGVKVPQPIVNDLRRFRHEGEIIRHSILTALPVAVVNNGSNFIALTQIVSEGFMFKANGTQLVSDKGPVWRYITDPPVNIAKSLISQNSNGRASAADMLKPSYIKGKIEGLSSLEAASKRDRFLTIDKKTGLHYEKLINRWQARATMFGLLAWGLNLISPESSDKPEDTERMAKLAAQSTPLYALERVRQGVWYPIAAFKDLVVSITPIGKYVEAKDGIENKRSFTGLGIAFAGMCSMIGGFRNIGNQRVNGRLVDTYKLNPAYCATGAISFVSGLQMLFAMDKESAYSRYGSTYLLRLLFLPSSIMRKFKDFDKNAKWYLAGVGGLQTTNLLSFFIGGAEKTADGQLVDTKTTREEAKEKYAGLRAEKGVAEFADAQAEAKPHTVVNSVADYQMAMPEIKQAMEKEAANGESQVRSVG